ncbi:PAAR-like domain-containing protein [Thiocapsa bogorovii]|uniref:PAAR-like domain-containing protein n=1 Tax=Thiocapsa bogorovii TaxID=521689 RepID=UPI001E3D0049|nr:PAAR-like domain-containing protein [Thiocapsa bogorovii]UHD16107.1 DUF4150 domain-containing protein [Thiocapsa bogorovii]
MANKVFSNGREVACAAGAGKTICAMPDVCFTPPENPATPPGVPVPYPNTGFASDTTDGSKSVRISKKEVMLKNQSFFKKSTGDEAGCASKKGVVSSKNTGKVYFINWSMDVLFEGANAVRHLDMTTNNHASPLANEAIPWPFLDTMTPAQRKACAGDVKKEKAACKDYKPYKKNGKDVCAEAGLSGSYTKDKATSTKRAQSASADPCSAARRCRLVPFNAKPQDGINGCCPAQTGDHIVPKSSFFKTSVSDGEAMPGWEDYRIDDAPCMCLEGGSCTGSHGLRHAHHKASSGISAGTHRSFDKEVKHCAAGAKAVAPQCNQDCIEAQLKAGHKGMGDQRKAVKYSPTGKNFMGNVKALLKKISDMLPKTGVSSSGA